MTNAEQFKKTFGIYAEEFWSYTEKQMLDWINTDVPDINVGDMISRQAAIKAICEDGTWLESQGCTEITMAERKQRDADILSDLPSAQPEQRYTEEELRVFQHGISLSLLSKRSSQHWQYDEDTATEIKFLERLYEKVSADMRGAE